MSRNFWKNSDIAPPFDPRVNGPRDIFGGDSSSPPAPDYTPMAQASEAAARIAAEQGDRVLAESKRQYDRNMEVAQPIINAQAGMMKSAQEQGDEYYGYWKSKARPVEDALNADAMKAGSDAAMEEAAGRASADVRTGTTQQANMMARQGMRYGWSPAKMAAMAGTMAAGNASAIAGASTAARDKEKAIGVAKKMDVAGLYRGMPGAAQGAYGAATNAGNSAVGNSVSVGNGMTNAAIAAGGLVNQGQSTRVSGLNGILNAQTSVYGAQSKQDSGFGGMLSGLGGLGQGIGAMKTAGMFASMSDRRLKENIVRVGEAAHGLGLYEFSYIGDPARFRGVMADEVEQIMPDAVAYDDLGFASVNYGMLGIQMEVL
jgi:hypothetical protein